MSTRSKIGILRKDGSVDHIYCHWDGYPEHNGVILYNNYSNINKLNELIANGDLSVLAEHVYPDPSRTHTFDNIDGERQEDVCVFYNRERGEDWKHTNPRTTKNLDRFIQECKMSDCDFAYLYDEENKDWLYSSIPYTKESDMNFISLGDSLLNMNCEIEDFQKEDYLIFDGMELLKDIDYYEFLDTYRNNQDAYTDIKGIFERNEFDTYINSLKDYKNDLNEQYIDKHIKDIVDYFHLENDIEI